MQVVGVVLLGQHGVHHREDRAALERREPSVAELRAIADRDEHALLLPQAEVGEGVRQAAAGRREPGVGVRLVAPAQRDLLPAPRLEVVLEQVVREVEAVGENGRPSAWGAPVYRPRVRRDRRPLDRHAHQRVARRSAGRRARVLHPELQQHGNSGGKGGGEGWRA